MIAIFDDGSINNDLLDIIEIALVRSFTPSQVRRIYNLNDSKLIKSLTSIVLINPSIDALSFLNNFKIKLIVHGSIPINFVSDLIEDTNIKKNNFFNKNIFKSHKKNLKLYSKGVIKYKTNFFNFEDRYLYRYDYEKSWNNFPYGNITNNDDYCSLSQPIKFKKNYVIAGVYLGNSYLYSYISLFKKKTCTILFVNRELGLCDSFEWNLIEKFISSYSIDQLKCIPYICFVPYGYDNIVTFRFDCDEDIESIKFLNKFLISKKLKLSLGITTKNLSLKNIKFLKNCINLDVLNHSHSHRHFWGEGYKNKKNEIALSDLLIQKQLDIKCDYAISPFHESSSQVIDILENSGYKGLIGGTHGTNKIFSIFRDGVISQNSDFIFSQQQNLFHGDIFNNSRLDYYKSFILNTKVGNPYCFLDHPISSRYDYGWNSEDNRLQSYKWFFNKIKSFNLCFMGMNEYMDFLYSRAMINCVINEDSIRFKVKDKVNNIRKYTYSYVFKNKKLKVKFI